MRKAQNCLVKLPEMSEGNLKLFSYAEIPTWGWGMLYYNPPLFVSFTVIIQLPGYSCKQHTGVLFPAKYFSFE